MGVTPLDITTDTNDGAADGNAGAPKVTLNVTEVVVVLPFGVVTVNVLDPTSAVSATVISIYKLESVPPLSIVAVTPVPLNVTEDAFERFEPVMVAANNDPVGAVFGEMLAIV